MQEGPRLEQISEVCAHSAVQKHEDRDVPTCSGHSKDCLAETGRCSVIS